MTKANENPYDSASEWTERKSLITSWVAMTGDASLSAVFDDEDQTVSLFAVDAP